MSFLIKNDDVWEKYEEIWDAIKNKIGIKFHSEPIYEKKNNLKLVPAIFLKLKIRQV